RVPDAHDACARVVSTRHAASPALRLQRFGRTGPQSLCRGRAPRRRPGTWLAFATLAGAASRPTFTTPHESAPRWTGRISPKVKVTRSKVGRQIFFQGRAPGQSSTRGYSIAGRSEKSRQSREKLSSREGASVEEDQERGLQPDTANGQRSTPAVRWRSEPA